MCRLQASDATCSTTRVSVVSPTDALIFAELALAAEVSLIHAIPRFVGCAWEAAFPLLELTLKFTSVREKTILRKRSSAMATALMALVVATGTREGWTNRLKRSGSAECT